MTDDTTLYTLRCSDAGRIDDCDTVASFLPGQFLELSLPGIGEIPISYCGLPSPDGAIELCIRHVGHVTLPLQHAVCGDTLALRGPFGHGFPLEAYRDQDLLLIAGGLGMAPLRSLLLALQENRVRYGNVTVLYAARQSGKLLFLEELLELQKQRQIDLHLAVDRHDDVLELPPGCRVALLPTLLDELELDQQRTYAALCGPPIVYPQLLTELQRYGIADNKIHFSLERRMKCGVGQCGHCAVGTYLCCVDGPVFSQQQLSGTAGALL
jgi:NAD(P)H-flavin reductase